MTPQERKIKARLDEDEAELARLQAEIESNPNARHMIDILPIYGKLSVRVRNYRRKLVNLKRSRPVNGYPERSIN